MRFVFPFIDYLMRAVRRLRSIVYWFIAETRRELMGQLLRQKVLRSTPPTSRPHELPGEVIVSLTSYPPRFPSLHLTLRCLEQQTVKPDRIILWVARKDIPSLPVKVRQMTSVTIRDCDDVRSYKKLVFTLREFPDAWIATTDDDLYLPQDWLERMIEALQPGVVVAHRAHRMPWLRDGKFTIYHDRQSQVDGPEEVSDDLLGTTGSGMLFPPRSLAPAATNVDAALEICPTGDDLWFGWAVRQAGFKVKKLSGSLALITWPGSQRESLWRDYNQTDNDDMIKALLAFDSTLSAD